MQKLWSYVAIPATALAVLTGSVAWVVLLRPFYYVQIGPLGVCQASGLTPDRINSTRTSAKWLAPSAEKGSTPAAKSGRRPRQ